MSVEIMSVSSPSIVEYFAEHEKYKCGYCKSPDTNFSYGMWAHTMRVQDYQALIDRGWRRSGKYCYKPIMDQTCCPMYTIRCEALDFKISKSQKKVVKKMAKFLRGELQVSKDGDSDESVRKNVDSMTTESPGCTEHIEIGRKNVADIDISLVTCMGSSPSRNLTTSPSQAVGNSSSAALVEDSKNSVPTTSTGKSYKAGLGLDPSKQPPKKAKLIRLERMRNKPISLEKNCSQTDCVEKQGTPKYTAETLEDLFVKQGINDNRLELRLVRTSPMSPEYKNTSKQSYELYKKYQMVIHMDPADKLTQAQYTKFLVESPLQIRLVPVDSANFRKTFNLSAKLFKKYQMIIHNDPPEECDAESFRRFLAASPLQSWNTIDGPDHGYGSFHQQYWVKGELIAVGVIDILPSCISSVYFFYDPIYSRLSLGTFGSLCEVLLTRQLYTQVSNLKYYYMGFYIHTCPKMRYKAAMRPSKLLCPETYVWCDIEKCLRKLDKAKYSRLNEDLDAIDGNTSDDVSQVSIWYKNRLISYHLYKTEAPRSDDDDEIKEYMNLVGVRCARILRLYRG